MNTSVFGIVCSATPTLHATSFWGTKELARTELKRLLDDRQYKIGVIIVENTQDKFSFIIGWEQHQAWHDAAILGGDKLP